MQKLASIADIQVLHRHIDFDFNPIPSARTREDFGSIAHRAQPESIAFLRPLKEHDLLLRIAGGFERLGETGFTPPRLTLST